MSFNLMELVKDQVGDQLLGSIGGVLGTDGSQTTGALSGALPGLLSGLMASSSSPAGAEALLDTAKKQDDGLLGNMGNLLGGDQSNALASQGNSILSSLLGSGALGQLAGVIASFSGISRGNSSSLLGMLAPIIIGVIKNKVMDGGMNASALSSMFTQQKDNINAAMPQGFSDQLQSAGFFDSISAQPAVSAPAPKPAVQQAPAAPAAPAASSGGLPKWLLPAVAVVVLGGFGLQYLGKGKEAANEAVSDVQSTATQATQQVTEVSADALQAAKDAMPAGVDLTKITDALEGMFGSTTEALSGITDVESAKAALPDIQAATSSLGGMSDVITRLPDAAKGPISAVLNNGIAGLQPLIEKVTAIPGVGALIQPVIGPVLETLQGLAS